MVMVVTMSMSMSMIVVLAAVNVGMRMIGGPACGRLVPMVVRGAMGMTGLRRLLPHPISLTE